MKAFVVLLAMLALVWLLSGSRRRRDKRTSMPHSTRATAAPVGTKPHAPMAPCAQCGVYLPRDEALPGRGGLFCSDEHRRVFEVGQRPS